MILKISSLLGSMEKIVANGKELCLTRHVIELHIAVDWFSGKYLRINNLAWLPSLMNLEHLKMDGVDLSRATNWLQAINMLTSLVELSLVNCSLHRIPPMIDHHNFSSLETLNLSQNNFNSSIPKWVFNLDNLVSLRLTGSNFLGPFLEGPVNLTSLTSFDASFNSFNCPLPRWLFILHNLENLVLSNCGIEGVVPNLISNLSSIFRIDLSMNALSGKLPNVIGKLWKLEELWLYENKFDGEISELFSNSSNFCKPGLEKCSSLKKLALSENKLTGTLPRNLGLSMLETFVISYNRLEGIVTESHFASLMQLSYFSASGNNLTLKVSQSWIPPFQARGIMIGGWNLGPHFPTWFQTQKEIRFVDISKGGLEGTIPAWFWNLTSQIDTLNISHNQFIGVVPKILETYSIVLASNNFSGPLPQISTTIGMLDLSNNSFSGGLSHLLCKAKNEFYRLSFLNLGGNALSGEIPDCWMYWPELKVLILRDNDIIGGIPRSIEVLSHLNSLDFRKNRLNGSLSLSLGNCTKLVKIDLAENELVGQLPPWLGLRLSRLIILNLRSNKFNGELPSELCRLKNLQILDLASNSFFGIIPRCIGNFTSMVTGRKATEFDLSYFDVVLEYETTLRESAMVATKGNMYQYDTILPLVTSMDISNNNLSGDIPTSLASLVGLRFCNFSKNHFIGRIPNAMGGMKVLESFDLSENQLSGQIPPSLSGVCPLWPT